MNYEATKAGTTDLDVLRIDIAGYENLDEDLHWSTQTPRMCRTCFTPSGSILRPQNKMPVARSSQLHESTGSSIVLQLVGYSFGSSSVDFGLDTLNS